MSIMYNTITDQAVATFEASLANESANQLLHELKVSVTPVQDTSGGDPSPTNICPISGWIGASVFRGPTTSQAAATEYEYNWQATAGTVYGGVLDALTGGLSVTYGYVADLGTLAWEKFDSGSYPGLYYTDSLLSAIGATNGATIHGICSAYLMVTNTGHNGGYGTNTSQPDLTMRFRNTDGRIYVTNSGITDRDSFVASLSGVSLAYELKTPQTYQLTGQSIRTLFGPNNVWATTGDIKTLSWQYSVFDPLQVFIDGYEITPLIAFGGWQRERNDVDGPEAGRTLDAKMHRARVATKMRYNVTCRPLRAGELASLERLIMPEYVTVKVVGDPYYGTWEKTCYVNNTSSQFLILKKNGEQWWGGITFPIIEV